MWTPMWKAMWKCSKRSHEVPDFWHKGIFSTTLQPLRRIRVAAKLLVLEVYTKCLWDKAYVTTTLLIALPFSITLN